MFFLYIDESGDPGRYLDANHNPILGSSERFTLGSIIVDKNARRNINMDVTALALSFFPQSMLNKTKLHYQQLIQKLPPYDSLSDSDRLHLADGMFKIIRDSPCMLLSVTIDLANHFTQYSYPINPKAYAILIMLERFQDFLMSKGAQGMVIYERISRRERKILKGTMNILKKVQTSKRRVELSNIMGDIQSGDPLEEPILQLADFFAYATQIMYKTNYKKMRRWESIKEKYYNLNGDYFHSGNVYR